MKFINWKAVLIDGFFLVIVVFLYWLLYQLITSCI